MNIQTIFIIEHNPQVAYRMEEKFRDLGYSVHTAGDDINISRVKELDPDLILLDVMMPEFNAMRFLGELKKSSCSHIPVIMTSLVGERFEEDSLRLGAVDFFRKPLDFDKLNRRIKSLTVRKTILVVDDDPMILRLLEVRLGSMGYLVETAPTGVKAIEKANEIKPDVILVDVVLPDIDGLEVINQLKSEDSEVAHIPVIAFTGKVTLDGMEDILGIDKFVGRNFSADDLVKEIVCFLKATE
ncbi:MAG: response regulator [Elusimicrobiota bacterium]|nr:response regulator [Elusimicrobiota bacterium]